MIKVLQILPGLNRGGLETFVMNIYRTIDRDNIQFDFLTNDKNGDYSQEIRDLGGHIFYIPPRRNGIGAFLKNLKEFFLNHSGEYNAVHYHESSLTSIEVLYFAKKSRVPVRIIHSHSSSIMGSKLHLLTHLFGKLAIANLATHYLGCSDKALDWMFRYTGIRKKATIIQNGINVNSFKYNPNLRRGVREKLNISQDCIVIGHIGRFSEVKNHSFLIDIFSNYLIMHSEAKLLLIGVGELQDSVKEKVKKLGITKSVFFLGMREDTAALYQAMDIFVMPSLYEGLPVTLVEAQASGLPILCSDTISKMSNITGNYSSMSILNSAKSWSDRIDVILNKYIRNDESSSIIKAGFDINTATNSLIRIYEGKK